VSSDTTTLTTQTETAPPAHKSPNSPSYKRLSLDQIGTVLRLHNENLTQAQIAQIVGVDQSAICRILQKVAIDRTDLAVATAKAQSFSAVRSLVRWGKTRDKVGLDANKTLLNIAGVTEKRQDHGVSLQVNVGVALPGTPQYTALVQQEAKVDVTAAHNPAIDV
jgi:transcriptional regulator with XRE-family HTH domain